MIFITCSCCFCCCLKSYKKKSFRNTHRGPARFLVDLGHISVEKKYILGKKIDLGHISVEKKYILGKQ